MNSTNQKSSMTPAEAFAAIPLAAICCDSDFGREEAHILKEQLIHRSPYKTMTPRAFAELIEGLLHRSRRDRWQELIRQALPALSTAQQEVAYAPAVQLVLCDRVVKPEEMSFLATLGGQLALPPGRAAQIQEVLALLQRDVLLGEAGA